jgi:hypothetical protein
MALARWFKFNSAKMQVIGLRTVLGYGQHTDDNYPFKKANSFPAHFDPLPEVDFHQVRPFAALNAVSAPGWKISPAC